MKKFFMFLIGIALIMGALMTYILKNQDPSVTVVRKGAYWEMLKRDDSMIDRNHKTNPKD
jgi:uncharacterized membrane protein